MEYQNSLLSFLYGMSAVGVAVLFGFACIKVKSLLFRRLMKESKRKA